MGSETAGYPLAVRGADGTREVKVGQWSSVTPSVVGGREVVIVGRVGSVGEGEEVRGEGAKMLCAREAGGLELLVSAREATKLPILVQASDPRRVGVIAGIADGIEVSATHMQDFALLSALGEVRVPILLRRGIGATVRELLMAAEYVLVRGNEAVVLCEGGIRTAVGMTVDLGGVAVLKRETHLPVVVDPGVAGGDGGSVAPLVLAAVAAGADGVVLDARPNGSGGADGLFGSVVRDAGMVARAIGRSMGGHGGGSASAHRRVRAVMGEGVVEGDSAEAVARATRGVLAELMAQQGVTAESVVSAVFTLTPDVVAVFPAAIAREMGWRDVPLLCVAAVPVPGAPQRSVAVMLHLAGG